MAITYMAPMNKAQWNLELSQFSCRMWQDIPVYGDAIFEYRAGEKQRFYLSPTRRTMKQGKALLTSNSPIWVSQQHTVTLAEVPVNAGSRPVVLKSNLANKLLHELNEGMSPLFSRKAWYSEVDEVQVGLSSVNFKKAYGQYRQCLSGLLPVNFDQISRSRLQYTPGRWQIDESARKKLDLIVLYAKADPKVSAFYVDGHTDDLGRRLANYDMSKKRAEAVTQYLVAAGIDEAKITTRYHGERYPIVKNKDSASRAKNRRVTVRLAR